MTAYKDGDRWRYRFSFRGKRYGGSTLTGDNTKRAAEKLERLHIEKLESGVFDGPMPRVREFMPRYLAFQKARVKPLTYILQETHLRVHVEPYIGAMLLDEVGVMAMDALVTQWKTQGAAPTTINARLITTRRLFAVAVEWKIIPSVPKVSRVKVPKDTPRFFELAEANALIAKAGGRWRSMVIVALRTGLRIGELRGLQWLDVDLTPSRACVRVRRTDPGVAGMASNDPKGGRGRTVPLSADAIAALSTDLEIAQRKHSDRWSLAGAWVWPGVDTWHDQRDRDRSRSEGGCATAIGKIIADAGIRELPGQRLGWHTLRHTFASWLVQRGVPLKVVQELLGHASIKQTERYAHLSPDATHHGAVAMLDLALAPGELAGAVPALPPGDEDDE
jgi:integrase